MWWSMRRPEWIHGHDRRRLPRSCGSLALGIAALVASGCGARRVPPDVGLVWGATVQDIVSDPTAAEGRIVTVSGEVNRVYGPRWFSIGGEGYGGGEELLVVGPTRLPGILDSLADSGKVANDLVQVTGRVRVFEEDAIEREIGADLDGDFFDAYDGKPVIVMHDLDITPRADVVPAVVVPVPVPVGPITDALVIVEAPDRPALVGRPVALLNVNVLGVAGPNAFWVGPDSTRRLLVVRDSTQQSAADQPIIRAGQTITVTGVVRALPTSIEDVRRAWGLSGDDAAKLSRERIFLSANHVAIAGSA